MNRKYQLSVFIILSVIIGITLFLSCNKNDNINATSSNTEYQNTHHLTLSEMANEVETDEERMFLQNTEIKDYTNMCKKINQRSNASSEQVVPIKIRWHWAPNNTNCYSDYPGICIAVVFNNMDDCNAQGYVRDGKLIIVPNNDENGYTADGKLAVGHNVELENSDIIIAKGIYTAYYDKVLGKYTSVAVDMVDNKVMND